MSTKREMEAAAMIRSLLAVVEAEGHEGSGTKARVLLRHLEGAAVALEQAVAVSKAELLQAADMIRNVVAAIEAGGLEADTPRDRALLGLLEGAAVALEEAARVPGR